MRKLLVVVLVIALCALFAWTLLERHNSAPTPIALTKSVSEKPRTVTELVAATDADKNKVREVAATELAATHTAPARAAADATAGATDNMCDLRGRFLLPGGTPAANVQLSVQGWDSYQERVLRYGRPKSFEKPTGSSGPDGRFSIRFDPPRAYQFVLSGKLRGFCEASWRWSEIEPRQIIDVGDVELERGGSIRGRILDAKDRALTQGWSAHADGPPQPRSKGRQAVSARSDVDPTTGEFFLDGLPPGSASLKAHSRIANWIEGPTVAVRAGEETRADIRYNGPDNESRIVVVTFSQPFLVLGWDAAEITIRAPGFEPRKAVKIAGSTQSHSFDDLPPGEYTIEVRDPNFLPWSKSGVRPGTSVSAMLKGNAAVTLTVVDDVTEQVIDHYALDVRFDNAQFAPATFRLFEDGDEPPRGGLVEGLVPYDQTLIVHAKGYADCEVSAQHLAANERRPLVARLVRGKRVEGIVRHGGPSRSPAAGISVSMTPSDDEGRARHRIGFGFGTADEVTTKTTANGAFAFEGVAPGEYTLLADDGALLRALTDVAVVKARDAEHVELVLPAAGRLVGKILAPEGASFAQLALRVDPVVEPAREFDELSMFDRTAAEVAIEADGSFRSAWAPAGEVKVSLRCPLVEIPTGRGSSMSTDGPAIELGSVMLSAEVETVREFDLRANFTGTVVARVRMKGVSAPGLSVALEGMERSSARGVTDSRGECRLGPVPPNRYRLVICPVDSNWLCVDPREIVVKSGETVTIDVEVTLFDGTFTLLDSKSRKALANTPVVLTFADTRFSARTTSDAEGRVKLALPAGRWSVQGGQLGNVEDQDPNSIVDWGPGGCSRTEITITPRQW